jgi:hypothetical protein
VLTLWAAVVAERLGHPPDTALTLGGAVAGAEPALQRRMPDVRSGVATGAARVFLRKHMDSGYP